VHIDSTLLDIDTFAGAMNSPNTLQSQPFSRPGRKPKHAGEVEEPGKKPKKVNSEIRKQQNRIASRNYRMSFPKAPSRHG
jgi:hypothetical protein